MVIFEFVPPNQFYLVAPESKRADKISQTGAGAWAL